MGFFIVLLIVFFILVGISLGTIVLAEAKQVAWFYLITMMVLLVCGSIVGEEGIVIDYGSTITENIGGNPNVTSVEPDTTYQLVLTTENDATISVIQQLLTWGSLLFIPIAFFRNDNFSREKIYRKYNYS